MLEKKRYHVLIALIFVAINSHHISSQTSTLKYVLIVTFGILQHCSAQAFANWGHTHLLPLPSMKCATLQVQSSLAECDRDRLSITAVAATPNLCLMS